MRGLMYSTLQTVDLPSPHRGAGAVHCPVLHPSGDKRNKHHVGPTSRIRLTFGRVLACRTRTARNRRLRVASQPGTGHLCAASARFLPLTDSGALELLIAQFLGEWRHRTAPKLETRQFQ